MADELIRICWVDYTPKQDRGDPPTVRICGRSEAGERVQRFISGCQPHLYVPAHAEVPDDEDGDWEILDVESGYQTHDNDDVLKVTVKHPKQVPRLKEEFDYSAEADIPFYRRATWDEDLSGYVRVPPSSNCHIDDVDTDIEAEDVDSISPRIVIGDIEVVPEGSKTFDEMKEAVEDPIVACSLYDTFSEEYLLAVVDPEGLAEGSEVKQEMEDHWGDHNRAPDFVDDASIKFVQADTEADLLNVVIGKVQDWQPDILSGWNWIDFDHDYLTKRAKKLDDVEANKLSDLRGVGGYKIETMIDGLPGFDEMEAYDDKVTFTELRSLSLEYVANEEIGIGKIDTISAGTAYENDRSRLAAYNLLDVQLCVALTEKHEMEEFYLDLADLAGIQVYDAFHEKRLVDGYIASRKRDDQILPNQAERNIVEPAGGLVLSPSKGVKQKVAVLDLKSLYPSSMITCNISPETLTTDPDLADMTIPGMPEKEADVGGQITEDDINWEYTEDLPWSLRGKMMNFDVQGILPENVAKLFVERARYKSLRDQYGQDEPEYEIYDRKQRAIKVIMNSFYGVSNSPYYRLARNGIGDAITGVSRYVLWRAAEYVEEMGYDVIYGDTDSVIVQLDYADEGKTEEELVRAGRGLTSQLNGYMDTVADDLGIPDPHPYLEDMDLHGTDQHCWVFEFEKLYDSFIQCGQKKRYAGKLAWKEGKSVPDDADPDITGFESQRADVPEVTESVQTEVIRRVLAGQSFEDVSEYVREQIDSIHDGTAELHEIGIPMSIGQPLSQYGNVPRARCARHANEHLGKDYGPGDTPWMFYVQRTPVGVGGTDVIGIDWNEDIPEGYEIDVERTTEKAFESALGDIIEEMGWSFDEIREGKQVQAVGGEDMMEYDGDPFASDPSDNEAEGSDDADEWEGAEAW